jgi:hypothetical protein
MMAVKARDAADAHEDLVPSRGGRRGLREWPDPERFEKEFWDKDPLILSECAIGQS